MRNVRIVLVLGSLLFSYGYILNMAETSFQFTEVISLTDSSDQMVKADLIARFQERKVVIYVFRVACRDNILKPQSRQHLRKCKNLVQNLYARCMKSLRGIFSFLTLDSHHRNTARIFDLMIALSDTGIKE